MTEKRLPPLIAVVGPTAVGKTETSLRVAASLGGEIVSADSRLLYRGMDIGTAKPSRDQLRQVRHHLIDVADPSERWSLATYQEAALAAIREVHRRGRLPFLVGGTGQYVRAVIEGWQPPSRPEDDRMREELEAFAAAHGAEALHRRLEAIDPARAAQLHPRNVRRVVRALEVYHFSGRLPSQQAPKQPPRYRRLWIGLQLPREILYDRIDRRIAGMLEGGWLAEVQGLMEAGLNPDHPNMSAIGYRPLAEHLSGQMPLEQAVKAIRRSSRQFVRRQANWFKPDDPRIEWYSATEGVAERLVDRIRAWLN